MPQRANALCGIFFSFFHTIKQIVFESVFIMQILVELSLLAIVISIIVYWPELFPRCSLCHHIKPRFLFFLHKDVSFSLSRKGNRSVCKKCCVARKIDSFSDLAQYQEIQKRVTYQTKSTFEGTPPHW